MEFSIPYRLTRIAQRAAKIILNADRDMSVEQKDGHGNFVTEYDLKVQQFIQKELLQHFPDAKFIGEEGDIPSELPDGDCFIVDPIDGTCNFMYDYKMSTISIAMLRDRKVIAAVVCHPYLDEFFIGDAGKGAYVNGMPLTASSKDFENSLVIFGTSPYYPELADKTTDIANHCLKNCRDIRRSGSASADLCWIASGRADLFFELKLSPWDFAAGWLICKEAGAKIVQLDGSELDFSKKCSVVAGSPAAVDRFIELFK